MSSEEGSTSDAKKADLHSVRKRKTLSSDAADARQEKRICKLELMNQSIVTQSSDHLEPSGTYFDIASPVEADGAPSTSFGSVTLTPQPVLVEDNQRQKTRGELILRVK